MRCFLTRKGHIAAIEFLEAGPDESLIEQGGESSANGPISQFDGFEIWDRARQVHVHPEPIEDADRSLHRPPDASRKSPPKRRARAGFEADRWTSTFGDQA